MSPRLLILFLLVCCCHLISATKRIRMDGKSYTVLAHQDDCHKYIMCSDNKCKVQTCQPTYVFDPATSTCTHRHRTSINCDFSRR